MDNYTIKSKLAAFGAVLALLCGLLGCSPKIVEKIVVEKRDSIITETRIDTVEVQLPPQYVKDYTALGDTLMLSTDYAEARAWVNMEKELLEGDIKSRNKPLPVPVTNTNTSQIHQSDSIKVVEVEKPYEVEKKVIPKWSWWSLSFNLFIILMFGIWIYLKIKKSPIG